jgi:hypothetical protein
VARSEQLLHWNPFRWQFSRARLRRLNVFGFAALAGVILLLPGVAAAQKVSAGIVAGGSLTDGFRDQTFYNLVPSIDPGAPPFFIGTHYWSPSKDYVAGGMIELHFTPRWSLEVNGLFRQLHGRWEAIQPDGSVNSISPHPVVTWQFPILGKYRFAGRKWSPFIEAGPSLRTAGNLNSSDPSHHGLTAGTGFEIQWGSLRIAPTVRYTLWAGDNNPGNADTKPDQLEILVGLSGQSESGGRPLGQHISVGFIVGTNLTGDYRSTNLSNEGDRPVLRSSGPRSFVFGPSVEVHLPRRFSVEVNALHRPISSATETFYEEMPYRSTYRAVTWVFPVLAKYRFSFRGLEPFAALGPSFRMRQTLAEAADASPYGITAGAGVEMRAKRIQIAPALRFTHWARDRRDFGGPVLNQAEVLVGVTF